MKRALLLALVVVGAIGCAETQDPAASTAAATSTTGGSTDPGKATAATGGAIQSRGPDMFDQYKPGIRPADGEEVAVLDTTQGRIVLRFFPDKAPNHVKNFKDLVNKKFYDGTYFHRVIPGFMIQGGDPNTKNSNRADDGQGGPGYNVNAEFSGIPHWRGILSMARTSDVNGAGSQFFIVVQDSNFLDGKYTVFGAVVEGLDIADKIVNLARDGADNPTGNPHPATVKSITIQKWPLK